MLKLITMWVLTVSYVDDRGVGYYQLRYADQKTCISQIEKHEMQYSGKKARCDFEQIWMNK